MEIPASLLGKAVTEGHIYYFKDDCPVGIRGNRDGSPIRLAERIGEPSQFPEK